MSEKEYFKKIDALDAQVPEDEDDMETIKKYFEEMENKNNDK